jgi:superfamily II DNA or RNA helicase
MPTIYDNIDRQLLPALRQALQGSLCADFCVGYFNLRGWRQLDEQVDALSGRDGKFCRLLVGMQQPPEDLLRAASSVLSGEEGMDNQSAQRLKKRLAEHFREQLTIGFPSNEDEKGLQRLAAQIRAKKVVVKLFLRHPLHAKLYLLFRSDPVNPMVGYLGSSNLTFAGLSHQGELNVDVMDHDACAKLAKWFEDRWNDRWCIDISDELVKVIEESWAREELIPPYHIYVAMAYHLSQDAREGLQGFNIPGDFADTLFDFQKAAVKIAAHHLNKRGGVLIGDVVGLGKTLMATALARIFEDDFGMETLIISPANLIAMWEDYRQRYRLHAKVLSIGQVGQLADLMRYRIVLIDESHNLRNREGKRYKIIQEYIDKNESKVILLSATPYNKTYVDLSNQLRLFVPETDDIGIRPEALIREIGDIEFLRRFQLPPRSLAAFEKSTQADDWRELMRLYMVRRTRSFIIDNYADTDTETGRRYLTYSDGSRSYFPVRVPKTVKFRLTDGSRDDQYSNLYDESVVGTINALSLPRYGLGNYIAPNPTTAATDSEKKLLGDLSHAGPRLMGFSRTNLFKRLESSGHVFIESVERHVLRNFIFLHAIEQGLDLPIGTQDTGLLDTFSYDEDADAVAGTIDLFEDEAPISDPEPAGTPLRSESDFRQRAADVYAQYATTHKKRFKWVRPTLFIRRLADDLRTDAQCLVELLVTCGRWDPNRDAKLEALLKLLTKTYPQEKVLVFSQFADTVRYLEAQLKARGVSHLAGVTGRNQNPTELAWRFSPVSNKKRHQVSAETELRVLLATDVLSEGQNLQDAHLMVNFDLPWAIIRLIQRAGRVDRIGQQAENIYCYTFLPAEGVERIIKLRQRVRQRLKENAEVVGTDEAFFEDDPRSVLVDLYNEKSGLLDADADGEVDLASYAYQIYKNATDADPSLKKTIPNMPAVVFSTKRPNNPRRDPEGVLVYLHTSQGNDALAWIGKDGKPVTESQLAILRAAECDPDTPALPRTEQHHSLVEQGVKLITEEERTSIGGQLGKPSGARFRTYERLKRYVQTYKGTLFVNDDIQRVIDEIYRFPLRPVATDTINRQLRSGISDDQLVTLVLTLREADRLCVVSEEEYAQEPQIICSMGLTNGG